MSAHQTTDSTNTAVDDPQDHTATYGPKATKIVVDGYESILSALRHAKKTKRFGEGRLLVEVVHSPDWTMPNLLSSSELESFQELSGEYLPEGVLRAMWYILENICSETRLMPAIVLDRNTGMPVVRLQ